jgi:hypothetical protein
MAEYFLHWWSTGAARPVTPRVTLQAESHFHGAALALRAFTKLGCDITAPHAHIDITESNGARQTLLVEEVLDWLNEPKQLEFIQREDLAALIN